MLIILPFIDDIKKQSPKNLVQLRELVVPEMVDKWYNIGIQLGYHPVELDRIKQNHQPRPVEEACQNMFHRWLEGTKNTLNSDLANNLIKAIDTEYPAYADEFNKGLKI